MVGYAGEVAELVLPRAAPPPADAGAWILLYLGGRRGPLGALPRRPWPCRRTGRSRWCWSTRAERGSRFPPGATAGALGEDGAETVTVTIQEVEPPAGDGGMTKGAGWMRPAGP